MTRSVPREGESLWDDLGLVCLCYPCDVDVDVHVLCWQMCIVCRVCCFCVFAQLGLEWWEVSAFRAAERNICWWVECPKKPETVPAFAQFRTCPEKTLRNTCKERNTLIKRLNSNNNCCEMVLWGRFLAKEYVLTVAEHASKDLFSALIQSEWSFFAHPPIMRHD